VIVPAASVLAFEPLAHEYRLPDGRIVPSVTQILKAVGVASDFEEIAAMSDHLAQRVEFKRQLGTALHADCHAFDDDDLEWDTVHPEVEPYLQAWAAFRENSQLAPLTRERCVFHRGLFFCGTLDGIFSTPTGRHVLVDIKTGNPDSSAAHLQTAAYEAAFLAERRDVEIHERWAVWLQPDKGIPYQITNYSARRDAWLDFQKFQACVTVFFEQAARRRGTR
jgi:hypothetical protein